MKEFPRHPTPWRCEETWFRDKVRYDSKSMIVDANGQHIITLGDGTHHNIPLHEAMAHAIVEAANKPKV